MQHADEVVLSWPDLHEGDGTVTVRRYFGRQLPWPVECEMWEIPAGGSEGLHTHPVDDPDGYAEVDELYVVIEGSADFILGEAVHHVSTGDAVFAPHDVAHGFRNTGASPLRLMVLSDPPREGAT